MPAHPLTRIVDWAQTLAAEVLQPGALAVDLTVGGGRDTLFLWQQVAPGGRVVGFDVQPAALAEAASRLRQAGAPLPPLTAGAPPGGEAGVYLAAACHSRFGEFLDAPPRVILANLGYHPGGNRQLITRPDTTLGALQAAARLLAPGGRLLVTVYPGHPGGAAEAAAVQEWFAALASRDWETLLLRVANREQAPYLCCAQKRGKAQAPPVLP